ncbi:RNA polymerase sigma-70 factor [Pedobacter sp. ASV28]|uniref:RNA polymerase sigma-70 factor n=1 Tax=Pedobacter sp. ASV28 TaxID=2795123 RepID=UPI0018EAF4F3|nr:RNA polymerase sigma-70 factor [Pedobacter sp. ASV28]
MANTVQDINSFEELFRDNYAKLCHFAAQFLNDTAAAKDIVQESFLVFWNLENKEKESIISISSFLYKTVRNACLNRLRRQKLEHSYLNQQAIEPVEDPVALNLMIKSEVLAEIHKILVTLPKNCQQIFRMGYLEGLKNQEIASALGISINTVKTQKKRGLQLLKMRLKPDFFSIALLFLMK